MLVFTNSCLLFSLFFSGYCYLACVVKRYYVPRLWRGSCCARLFRAKPSHSDHASSDLCEIRSGVSPASLAPPPGAQLKNISLARCKIRSDVFCFLTFSFACAFVVSPLPHFLGLPSVYLSKNASPGILVEDGLAAWHGRPHRAGRRSLFRTPTPA